MLRLCCVVMGKCCFLLLLVLLVAGCASAQSETATLSGQVVDPSGLNIMDAHDKSPSSAK
jgi:ABC-type Fe3+-citrate transport system substrate-binding protein